MSSTDDPLETLTQRGNNGRCKERNKHKHDENKEPVQPSSSGFYGKHIHHADTRKHGETAADIGNDIRSKVKRNKPEQAKTRPSTNLRTQNQLSLTNRNGHKDCPRTKKGKIAKIFF